MKRILNILALLTISTLIASANPKPNNNQPNQQKAPQKVVVAPKPQPQRVVVQAAPPPKKVVYYSHRHKKAPRPHRDESRLIDVIVHELFR